jgi:hypothetical protein
VNAASFAPNSGPFPKTRQAALFVIATIANRIFIISSEAIFSIKTAAPRSSRPIRPTLEF